jgi:hypothetical protein
MVSFSEDNWDQLDWRLMQNGAITLYFQMAILEADLAWLRTHGYHIETIDCQDLAAFRRQMSLALRFKEQFGYDAWTGNLDALNDAFSLEIAPETGLVFCFLRYDLLKAASPELAEGVLDIIEWNSRDHLLLGRRLLALVQSDDPRIQFGPLGARSANWNEREWLNKNRGLLDENAVTPMD